MLGGWLDLEDSGFKPATRKDEEGSAGTYFHFARIDGERQVTFEIQHDDARRSVTYSLDGESLRVQLAEQEGAGEPVTQVFVYRRVS